MTEPIDSARLAYAAYAESSGNRNYQGLPMPTWDELPEAIRGHWRAAIGAARQQFSREMVVSLFPKATP